MLPKAEKVSCSALLSTDLSRFLMKMLPTPEAREVRFNHGVCKATARPQAAGAAASMISCLCASLFSLCTTARALPFTPRCSQQAGSSGAPDLRKAGSRWLHMMRMGRPASGV